MLDQLAILEALFGDVATDERLVIAPIVDLKVQLQPSSIDVRLGTNFKVFTPADYDSLDPISENAREKIGLYTEEVDRELGRAFILHPGNFALATTLEYVRLPPSLTAHLDGRSSWARLGLLVHSTGGLIDPGFEGNVTFELINAGHVPLYLWPGVRIAQLAFHRLEGSAILDYRQKAKPKYAGQSGAGVSKITDDVDVPLLRFLADQYDERDPPRIRLAVTREARHQFSKLTVGILQEMAPGDSERVVAAVVGRIHFSGARWRPQSGSPPSDHEQVHSLIVIAPGERGATSVKPTNFEFRWSEVMEVGTSTTLTLLSVLGDKVLLALAGLSVLFSLSDGFSKPLTPKQAAIVVVLWQNRMNKDGLSSSEIADAISNDAEMRIPVPPEEVEPLVKDLEDIRCVQFVGNHKWRLQERIVGRVPAHVSW